MTAFSLVVKKSIEQSYRQKKRESMRTENEMMNLILQLAKDDDRIRCVYLTGSRANPNVEKDN